MNSVGSVSAYQARLNQPVSFNSSDSSHGQAQLAGHLFEIVHQPSPSHEQSIATTVQSANDVFGNEMELAGDL